MEQNELIRAIEAILFAAGERIEISRLAAVLETDADEIEQAADALADQLAFERRGIRILKLEKGYQMVSSGEMADYVTKALETRKPPKLSSSQLESLTIIAYYQLVRFQVLTENSARMGKISKRPASISKIRTSLDKTP